VGGLVEPAGQEALELGPALVEDAEGGIAGAGHLGGDLEHPIEDGLEVEVRDKAAAGIEQAPQPLLVEDISAVHASHRNCGKSATDLHGSPDGGPRPRSYGARMPHFAPFRVLIAGGGPAAVEGALALQRLAAERVTITLLAPEPYFTYRPLAVAEPFALGTADRFSLAGLCAERGFDYVRDGLAAVDVAGRAVRTTSGASLSYDALLVAVGAGRTDALPGALCFYGSADAARLRAALEALPPGKRRVAFVAAPTTAWTLPLYELATMTARWARERGLPLETWLVTHEGRALGVFGDEAAVRVSDLLEDAGVRLWTGAFAECVEDGRLWLELEGGLPVDLAVALPGPVGPAITGLPADEQGFVPVDGRGHVRGAPGVYAAGDVTTHLLKQGGLATQQSDVAAAAIAEAAGADVVASAHRPVLRGMVLTGSRPLYLSHAAGRGGSASETAPWWPAHKIAARHLSPYLASHPELRVPAELAAR